MTRWRRVKDTQTTVPEAYLGRDHGRAVIWATMRQRGQHAFQHACQVRRTLFTQADVAEDSTHTVIVSLPIQSDLNLIATTEPSAPGALIISVNIEDGCAI